MGNNEDKKEFLCEDERFILDVLRDICVEKDDVIAVILFLNQDKESKLENAKKLRKYIEFKGKYITYQNILRKSIQITMPWEQYYPCEMYVKYTGEKTEQLSNGKVYYVEMVFGDDEYYLIECDDGCMREFSAEMFDVQKVSGFKYTGSENDDGSIRISEGFVVGEEYEVKSFEMGKYTCENGLQCMLDEVEPIAFQKSEPITPMPYDGIDDALRATMRALEFGSVRQLSIHIHPECEYISQSGKKEFHTKKEIVKHLQRVSKAHLESDTFIDCALATITKTQENNKFSVGERCFAIYEIDGCRDVAFVILSEDNRYITGIYILNEIYEFKFD